MGFLTKVKYAVLMTLPGGVTNVILYDRFGNVVSEAAEEEGQKLLDAALGAGADLVDSIGDVALDVANAGLDLIEGAGLAVISGAELMYDYGYNKISPHRVEAVTALTALTVYITTFVIVVKKIRGAN